MASCKRTVHGYGAGDALHAASERAQRPSAAPSRDATEQRFQLTSYFTFYFCSAKSTPPRARTKEVSTASAPGCATSSHASSRSLQSASHACTQVYNTLDTHAERLQVSLVTLILHTHVHVHVVHVGATLLGQSRVCCLSARSRATGSRMHARGMFA